METKHYFIRQLFLQHIIYEYRVTFICSKYASTVLQLFRIQTSKVLQVPRTNLRFGSCSFHVSAPTLWNSLPHSVRFCESLTTFRKRLKTFYFYFQASFSDAP